MVWIRAGAALLLGSFPGVSIGDVALERSDDCDILVSGTISSGDVQTFAGSADVLLALDREAYQSDPNSLRGHWPRTVCLNSAGGSYAAGIDIANLIQGRFGTRLMPEAECYSACAVVFMSGSAQHPDEILHDHNPEDSSSGWLVGPKRLMAPTAILGFHAPYIEFSGRDTIPVQEAQEWMTGVSALTGFLVSSIKENFPPELAQEMLARGPGEFFFIDEVGQLNAWGIDLETDFHPRISMDMFRRSWSVAAHQFGYGGGGYGSIGDTSFGLKGPPAQMDSASGWASPLEAGQTQSGSDYLLVGSVGREASFGAALIDYVNVFQLRVLSPDFTEEYARFDLQGWQMEQPSRQISSFD